MHEKIYGSYDTALLVKTNQLDLIHFLDELYGDYFHKKENPIFTITFIVKQSPPKKFHIIDKEEKDTTNNFITQDKDGITIYFTEYNDQKKLFAKRIFTNSFLKALQKNGYIILHSAAISNDTGAILIIGDKGAGKTTTLLTLINKYNYNFISNDKIALKKLDNKYIVCGIPHSMGIIKEDLEKLQIKNKYHFFLEQDKCYIEIKDIKNVFQTKVIPYSSLNKIIFTKYTKGTKSLKTLPITEVINYLGENILDNPISKQKQYLNKLLNFKSNIITNSFFSDTECHSVIQGEKTDRELSSFLKR